MRDEAPAYPGKRPYKKLSLCMIIPFTPACLNGTALLPRIFISLTRGFQELQAVVNVPETLKTHCCLRVSEAILLSGDTFVNIASPRKSHFILESLKLRSTRVQFLPIITNRFQQTPLQHSSATTETKTSLYFFFFEPEGTTKKPPVYKTDNNGKIDNSLKQ